MGEAPPVADEASRFRGSAPIGGHDSARQSVGTTVGKRAPPLRATRNRHAPHAKLPVIAKPVTDVTGCGNPYLFGPLPKGAAKP